MRPGVLWSPPLSLALPCRAEAWQAVPTVSALAAGSGISAPALLSCPNLGLRAVLIPWPTVGAVLGGRATGVLGALAAVACVQWGPHGSQ